MRRPCGRARAASAVPPGVCTSTFISRLTTARRSSSSSAKKDTGPATRQIVNANQVALNSAVQQYKAAYARELKKLSSLLRTAKANAFPHAVPTSTR